MQKRSLETRSRILNTSLELFSTIGYEKTGVALICSKSDVSKGAFYHHFPSKHSVFMALLENWLIELDSGFDQKFMSSPDAFFGILAMSDEFSEDLKISPRYLPLFLEFWLQSVRDPEIWNQTIAPYQRYLEKFTQIFDRGISEGVFQSIDPAVASYALVGMSLGLLLQNMMNPENENWPSISKNCVALFINGLKGDQNA